MQTIKEIEYSYLGCIFDNPPERIVEALNAGTKQEWFSDTTCRLIWAAIESLLKKKSADKIRALLIIQEANALTLKRRSPFYGQQVTSDFIDETQRFRDSVDSARDKTIDAFATQLRTSYRGRALEQAMERAQNSLSASLDTSTPGIELVKQINAILADDGAEKDINVSDLLNNMTASYDKAYEEFAIKHNYNFVPGIPYPWDRVSHLTNGLMPGLHIIAARPSVGKTSYVIQCIIYWCSLGYKVAFNCLDMGVSEMIKRPVSNLAFVPMGRMERGRQMPDEAKRNADATEVLRQMWQDGRFIITYETDVDKFKNWCAMRHAAGKLDVAIVDYAQKFRLKTGRNSEYEVVTYAAGVLKEIANECLMPVIALSQLSRDNVKDPNGSRPPELSDLRGSGALEQDATSVVLLHKEFEVMKGWATDPPMQLIPPYKDPRQENEIRQALAAVKWNLAKNQNGATGEVPFVVYQPCFRWYMGDYKAPTKYEQFAKILADYRFMEEPFVSAELKGGVVYPEYWAQKCAIMCGDLGVRLPPGIESQLSEQDRERYREKLAKRSLRVGDDEVFARKLPQLSDNKHAVGEVSHDEQSVQEETSRNLQQEIEEFGTSTFAAPSDEPVWDDTPF